MKLLDLVNKIKGTELDETFKLLYGEENISAQKERYLGIIDRAKEFFKDDDEVKLFSAPGRCEIGGNHTDHQLGRVLAASINLDVVGIAKKTDDMIASYHSKDFNCKPVDLKDLEVNFEEKNTTEALIRGMNAKMKEDGFNIGGFVAYAESNVLTGSGMSSSAAFEVFVGLVINYLYNEGKVDAVSIAKYGQYAENIYFMKDCGLMDQMACSCGHFVAIDFQDKENPQVETIDFDPESYNYKLIVTNTLGSHEDLSDEYSAIPNEMKGVARVMNQEVLSTSNVDETIENIKTIREKCGDRAFLRSYHFMNETERAFDEAEALKANDFETFLALLNESGHSSWMYLQNVLAPNSKEKQELGVGLALSEYLLKENGGYRVHGGGFAGTILAFVPNDLVDDYIYIMEQAFAKDCCYVLRIRNAGGIQVA